MKKIITRKPHNRASLIILVLSIGALLFLVPLKLKAATKIKYGETVQGTISSPFQVDRFTFNGIANNIITILASRSAGSILFSPKIKILQPDGSLLQEVASDPTNPSVRIDNLTLPTTGVYTILLLDGFSRIETGNYGLTMQRTKPPFGMHINYGTITKDTIKSAADINAYTFDGTANNIITISASRTGGSLLFSPRIEVYRPNGILLQAVSSDPYYPFARINNLTLPATGTYTILLLDGFDRIETGTYKLRLIKKSSLTNLSGNNIDAGQMSVAEDSKVATNFDVTVTPNPSSQQFRIFLKGSNAKDKLSIKVYDANGRLIEERNNLYNSQTVTIGERYLRGMYFVEVVQNQVRKIVKIIKQ